jgi:hypothetical protein
MRDGRVSRRGESRKEEAGETSLVKENMGEFKENSIFGTAGAFRGRRRALVTFFSSFLLLFFGSVISVRRRIRGQ